MGENLSPQALRLLGEAGMTVNQQRMLPIQQQRADASTSQAQSAAVRAARPPQGRAPAQITEAQMLYDFLKIPPNQRTTEQQNFIDRKTEPTGGGPRRPSRPSATGGLQIRPVRN